ncbi:hypothetical protein G7046_g4715 [Stylonectria norvegica]|nr:hypothetical protein G7046_g4715 [Stylonectria norvegica]
MFPPTPPQESVLWRQNDKDSSYPGTPSTISLSSTTRMSIDHPCSSVHPNETPIIAVIGAGYVGTHLISSFASRFEVIGFDISAARVHDLRKEYKGLDNISFSSDPRDLEEATHFLISVPALLRNDKSIDSSYLREALNTVKLVARRGSTVVIESSVAVGMTRKLLGPLAATHGWFAGMSPERVDSGRVQPPVRSIPKIISGLDDIVPGSLNAINRVYSAIFKRVVPVSKPEVAEMMSLYENCQRMICIAYANEMADACIPHDIDPYEVCEAASTKPFGYMPYTPGVGVGGDGIPVNPFYLLSNNSFPVLETAANTMQNRPAKLSRQILSSLKKRAPKGDAPRILVVGMGFKAGQSHINNSPGADLARNLEASREVDVFWADSLVKQKAIPQIRRLPDHGWCKDVLDTFDVIVVAARQPYMDFGVLDELEDVQIDMHCF